MEKAFPAQPPDLALEASVQAGTGVPIVEIEMEFDGHLDERILAHPWPYFSRLNPFWLVD